MVKKVNLPDCWYELLKDEFSKPYFDRLITFVDEQYADHRVFPPRDQVFRAFDLCPLDKVRVVILGQDPYHGDGQANGLCFSVPSELKKLPPSLKNIFKEIAQSYGTVESTDGDLQRWATQGVLLLNSALTVDEGVAGSHAKKGWTKFTDAVIKRISEERSGVVFLLWGKYAESKRRFIEEPKHKVLTSVHPSPLSAYRGFFGCNHFKEANNHLDQPIKWQ